MVIFDIIIMHTLSGLLANRGGIFGRGLGRIHLDDLNCTGTEPTLNACIHTAFEAVTCTSSESDAGVICPGTYM